MIKTDDIRDCLLINDDCFKVLKELEDNSVELILTDPPYNIAKYSTGNMKFDWRSDINNDIAQWFASNTHAQVEFVISTHTVFDSHLNRSLVQAYDTPLLGNPISGFPSFV